MKISAQHAQAAWEDQAAWEEAADGGAKARRMMAQWGAAPLHFFALLPDKRYLFSGPGELEWGVAYRVVGRQALALGDPLGNPEAAPDAIAAFAALCRRQGWKPVWYQTALSAVYGQAGLHTVKVGEDAQIALMDFSLAGKKYVKMRNDLRRVEKSGIALETYGPNCPPPADCTAEMDAISRSWRQAHNANEGWFAMGGFDPQSRLFAESRYFVARDTQTGRVAAFTTFVPVLGPDNPGWTLDLMRRQADAMHGVMDFLIVAAATQFAAEGAKVLSLGLSPLAGDDDPAEAAATSHIRRFLYTRLNRAYNFQGLHTFKAKFATHWEPRFLAYSGRLALTSASSAVLKAHITPPAPQTPKVWNTRSPQHRAFSTQRQAFAVCGLLFLGLMPFEKTLAKQASLHPVHWGRLHSLTAAHYSLSAAHYSLSAAHFSLHHLKRHHLKRA